MDEYIKAGVIKVLGPGKSLTEIVKDFL
jgi:hypothetical protein